MIHINKIEVYEVAFDWVLLPDTRLGCANRQFRRQQNGLEGQSAVSLQMNRLEEMTGTAAFEQADESSDASGAILAAYARRMLALNDEAMQAVSGIGVRGTVRLGLLQDFSEAVLPGVLATFSRASTPSKSTCKSNVRLICCKVFEPGDLISHCSFREANWISLRHESAEYR